MIMKAKGKIICHALNSNSSFDKNIKRNIDFRKYEKDRLKNKRQNACERITSKLTCFKLLCCYIKNLYIVIIVIKIF